MTKTAIELWNDINFINKRIDEQIAYLDKLVDLNLPLCRKKQLKDSADAILVRFLIREKELTK